MSSINELWMNELSEERTNMVIRVFRSKALSRSKMLKTVHLDSVARKRYPEGCRTGMESLTKEFVLIGEDGAHDSMCLFTEGEGEGKNIETYSLQSAFALHSAQFCCRLVLIYLFFQSQLESVSKLYDVMKTSWNHTLGSPSHNALKMNSLTRNRTISKPRQIRIVLMVERHLTRSNWADMILLVVSWESQHKNC